MRHAQHFREHLDMSRYGESSDFCDDSGFRLRGSFRLIRAASPVCGLRYPAAHPGDGRDRAFGLDRGRCVLPPEGVNSEQHSDQDARVQRRPKPAGSMRRGKGLALGRWRGPARRTTRAVDLRSKSAASSMAYESSCAFRRSRIPSVLLQQWHCHAARLNRCESSPGCMRSSRWRA